MATDTMGKLNIDADTWMHLNRLLDAALDRPPPERAEWLESLGPEYGQLKAPLLELLARAAMVETGEFLRTLPKFDSGPVVAVERGERIGASGEQVGPYRLVRELGSGGMGSVWLAERTDGLIKRPVALKLPHLVTTHRASLAERMAREREILATLDHRNIARLFDAGLSAAGQPFLALEYVEGRTIDRYCADMGEGRPASLEQRLKLFQQVANAVAYAHGKLVIHRDLKPANILVTTDGGVKLLDFGIAKLLEQGEAKETRLTELSGRALTPDYAAPEQIVGDPLTVASDVYSLGVILYELLAMTRPYRLKRESRGALEEAILQIDPKRPSEVAAPEARKQLRGDLDTIALKALKKRAQDRYATVNAFADDIDRYLHDRPVLARPDSRWYRLCKFVTRNKLAVGAGVAVLLAVVAGAAVALWQARVAIAERDRAAEVKDFVTAIFRDADPWFGPQEIPSAAAVLKRARQAIDAEFAVASPTRVELLNVLGESLIHLQDADGASEILGIAAADAERVHGATHPQTLRAHLLLSQAQRSRGEAAAARAALDRVLPTYQDPATPISRDTVTALIQHAGLVGDTGDAAAAAGILQQTQPILEALPGDRRTLELTLLSRLADTQEQAGDLPGAMKSAGRAYEVARSLYEQRGGHPDLITARKMYARQLARSGDLRQAITLFTQSVDEARRVLDPDSNFVAEVEQNAVQWLVMAGELARAREYAAHASAVFEKSYAPDSLFLAAMFDSQALVELSARRPEAALQLYERVVAMTRPALGPTHPVFYTQRMNRALSLAYAGRGAGVLPELQAIAGEYPKTGAPNTFVPLRSLGEAQRLLGNYRAAAELQRQSLQQIPAGLAAARHRSRGLTELGLALNGLGDFANARPAFDEALTLYEQTLVSPTPYRADALVGRGVAHLALGNLVAAIADLEAADAYWRGFDPENRWSGEAAAQLVAAYRQAGRERDAGELQSRARRILADSPFPQDAKLLER